MAARYASLPFVEQIRFLRRKLNIGTESWTDIFESQHDHAFVVAGAMKQDLLDDLRGAVDRVIAQGITLQDFKKDFLRVVAQNGWSGWTGEDTAKGRAWRARVIYDTNLRTSYAAGRFVQMKTVAASRPFWRYRHNDSVEHPRPEHVKLNGLVLRHDDPFWRTHYPPNGWGCKCYVETMSVRDLSRTGKQPDTAPPIEYETVTIGTRGPNPRTVVTPKGIDPGFGYAPGEAQLQARQRLKER